MKCKICETMIYDIIYIIMCKDCWQENFNIYKEKHKFAWICNLVLLLVKWIINEYYNIVCVNIPIYVNYLE